MVEYDPYDPEVLEDPYPIYSQLRAEAPAYYIEEFDTWFLSRFEDIWQINTNFKALSSQNGTTPGQLLTRDTAVNRSLASMDAPRHSLHRALISPTFKPGRVRKLEPQIREFARSTLQQAMAGGEEFDLLQDYAAQIAIRTVCLVGGLPAENLDTALGWVNGVFEREPGHRGTTESGMRGMRDMYVHFLELVKSRRENPDGTEGILHLLLTTDLEGGLSDLDIVHYLTLLLIGGTDTFPKSLTNTVYQLELQPEAKAEVRANPDLITEAFHETIRYNTPTQMLGRTLVEDVELHGHTLHAGQQVMFLFASANRDDREFENPDVYDLHRRPPRILAFGCGPHLCLGMHVARLEARIALEEFFAAVSDYEVQADRADWLRTEFVRGFTSLPVKFKRA
jgi:cytochrome P450